MGRIRDLHQLINGKLPSYNSAFIKSRGIGIPLDLFLGGYIRFAKRIGNSLPIWLPEISTKSTSRVTNRDTRVQVEMLPSWIEPGDKIQFGRTLNLVEDIVPEINTIVLNEPPQTIYEAGTNVDLFSVPLEMNGTFNGSPLSKVSTFIVHSKYRIFNGDQINWNTSSFDVISLDNTGVLPDGRYTYILQIEGGIPETLVDGSKNQVYLRAHPAYESRPIEIPRIAPSIASNIGPFLFDRVSGTMFTDIEVEEFDTIYLHRPDSSVFSTRTVSKNELILNRGIGADTFLFYDPQQGSLNYNNTTSEFVAITSDHGRFHIHNRCIPTLKAGQTAGWTVRFRSEVDVRVIIELEPNPRVVYNIPGGLVPSTVNIPFPNADVERIHVLVDAATTSPLDFSNKRIYMGNWNIVGEEATLISHATVARATGEYTWGSTGLFVKPMFMLLDYLRASSDLYSRLNAGLIA